MNTSAKGRAYEWEVRASLEKHGFTVLRMAASLGPFDLVVFNDKKVGWFQCKAGRFSCAAAERLSQMLPKPPWGDVAVVHECRKGCRTEGHVPKPHCTHFREAPDG